MSEIVEVAAGLEFPEGPIWMADGSVLLVEIKRGTLSRVLPDGSVKVVADTGGGPNGAAIGPDGAVYVAYIGTGGHLPQDAKNNSIWSIKLRVRADHSGIELVPVAEN